VSLPRINHERWAWSNSYSFGGSNVLILACGYRPIWISIPAPFTFFENPSAVKPSLRTIWILRINLRAKYIFKLPRYISFLYLKEFNLFENPLSKQKKWSHSYRTVLIFYFLILNHCSGIKAQWSKIGDIDNHLDVGEPKNKAFAYLPRGKIKLINSGGKLVITCGLTKISFNIVWTTVQGDFYLKSWVFEFIGAMDGSSSLKVGWEFIKKRI